MASLADLAQGVAETLQNAQTGAANGAAIDLDGARALSVQITGTFTGITANFEGSLDGATYAAVGLKPASTNGTAAATATAAGLYTLPLDTPPLRYFRARTTVATPTGSMTIVSRKMG